MIREMNNDFLNSVFKLLIHEISFFGEGNSVLVNHLMNIWCCNKNNKSLKLLYFSLLLISRNKSYEADKSITINPS